MYANLLVTTSDGKELNAWKVEVDPSGGSTTVYLDDPDGPEERYANPAGELKLRGACEIEADW